jgi:hypothetical protein
LVMGLQTELGISPVVANFGPTTASRFQALGPIGLGWDRNRNIVAILQHGLFCKGYWSVEPGSYGWYTGVTVSAVKNLRSNMGIPDGNGTIDATIARCILNMDAYVVVAGGTDKIRDIQRWLNGRYWQRPAYTIGPCDGIYSRDVQRALDRDPVRARPGREREFRTRDAGRATRQRTPTGELGHLRRAVLGGVCVQRADRQLPDEPAHDLRCDSR